MGKRANGEGSIYKTTNPKTGKEVWKVSISLGPSKGGKRKRICRNAATKTDAVAILAKLRGDGAAAVNQPTSRIAVSAFLADWLRHIETHKEPATATVYKSMVERVIAPRIGTIHLGKLTTAHVQSFADALVRDEVTPRTRQMAFSILRTALRFAVRTGRIERDPSAAITKPAHRRKDIFPFTKDEASKILAATAGTRWHAMIVLALTTGMRQGELFGLTWEAVDLKGGKLRVFQAAAEVRGKVSIRKPKTKHSERVIELPPIAIEALRNHLAVMMAEGNAGNKLVFPAPLGGLMPRSTFRHRYWLRILKSEAVGADPRGFHHCRHTYATLALGAGVPVHVVSRVLGHSKASTTLDIYAHVLQTHQSAATEAAQRLFG